MQFKLNLNPGQKRKILLIIRLLLLAAACFYLLFLLKNNFLIEDNQFQLYFANQAGSLLVSEKRELTIAEDKYRTLVAALIEGPQTVDLEATIPAGVKLIDYQIKAKTITLNFNTALRDNHSGGSAGETLTVYSIVNTLTALSEIDRVTILIDGQQIDSLVGHLDLSRPLRYNQKLVAGN